MKVSDILRVKGAALHTSTPDRKAFKAVRTMTELDLGSLLVLDGETMVGILTFREILIELVKAKGQLGQTLVREVMDPNPLTCTPDTEVDEVRRMMLARHARYMPVLEEGKLLGVVSLYDVAKAVVDSQNLENQLLKAYIRDWPDEAAQVKPDQAR